MAARAVDPRDRVIAVLERQLAEANRTIRELTRALRPPVAPVSRETPSPPPDSPDPRAKYSDELINALLDVAPDPASEEHRAHLAWIEREKRKGKSDLDLAQAISDGLDPDLFL